MKRLRVKFIKGEELKYLSHLDILRTFTRAIRRSGVPVIYSQGFNPHPNMSFALPLSVGVTSEGELVDIDVEDIITPEVFIKTINKGLPKDLKVIDAEETDVKSNIMAIIKGAIYKVRIDGENLSDIINKVKLLLLSNEILMQKETKSGVKESNIRPAIQNIEVIDCKDNFANLLMKLDAGSQSNLKPDLVVEALKKYDDLKVSDITIHRLELLY